MDLNVSDFVKAMRDCGPQMSYGEGNESESEQWIYAA